MRLKSQRGQGMTEYIILVALIAIAAIVAVKKFGGSTTEAFEEANETMSGVKNSITDKTKDAKLPN